MKNGQVASVIDSLSKQIRDAGKNPKIYSSSWDLAEECRTDTKGVTPCYGAVVFHSSPTEGSNESSTGFWNYTLRGDGSTYADMRNDMNGPEKYLLPLQRALDMESFDNHR